jgi:hypothetical protein
MMGGAGILMSGNLLRKMAPGIGDCRQKYWGLNHGDARITACLMSMDLWPVDFCNVPTIRRIDFSSASAWHEASIPDDFKQKAMVVSIHEKDPKRIRLLNTAIEDLVQSNRDVRWESLKPYLDNFTQNITGI